MYAGIQCLKFVGTSTLHDVYDRDSLFTAFICSLKKSGVRFKIEGKVYMTDL